MAKNKRRKALFQIFLIVGILSLLAFIGTKIYDNSKTSKRKAVNKENTHNYLFSPPNTK